MHISSKGQALYVERLLILFLTIFLVLALYNIIFTASQSISTGFYNLKSRIYRDLIEFYIKNFNETYISNGKVCFPIDLSVKSGEGFIEFLKDKNIYRYNWKYNITGYCYKDKKICLIVEGNKYNFECI